MTTDPRPEDSKSGSIADSFIGRVVVDASLATAKEVQACLTKQQQLRAAGKQVRLADILVKAGFITRTQIKRLASPSDDSSSRSLQKLPGFQLMQKVGAGAMASVYKAKQLSLDRVVAIKVLPSRLSEDAEFVERFYKEGKAAAKLSHNNIVQAIDVSESSGIHYFVMEYVDGETVYDRLVQQRVFSEEEALDVMIQIARALEHAHARGLIHRDVKPKNIMITHDGVAKLADMGLAREADDAEAAAAEKGRAFGTPYYISPEQIRGVVDVDYRADIYSFGATLYHMVTGRVPFDGPTPAAVMHKHLREPLVPPDHLNTALSSGLGEVVEHAMAKDRDRRYRSTADLLTDLERIRRGESPLHAHTSYDDDLLQNLAVGQAAESPDGNLRDGAQNLPGPFQSVYFIALVAVAALELIVIVILLATR